MTYRLRNILIAIALALVAALLTVFYVSNYKKSVKSDAATVSVLVASRDIPVGTLGAQVVSSHMLTTETVPRKSVVAGTITAPSQVSNLIVTEPVYVGEQVTARRFGPIVEVGVRTKLRGTYRAVQVAGDPYQVLSGTLKDGDHVDIVGVARLKSTTTGDEIDFSRIVIRDVTVLGTSGDSKTGAITTSGANNWVMLRVTDSQAQKLAFIYKQGDYWSLALRPSVGAADSPNSVETGVSLLTNGIAPAQISRALGGQK